MAILCLYIVVCNINSHIMKINIILVLFLIVSLSIGCYQEAEPKDPNNFIGLWSLYIMEELNSETGEWSEWKQRYDRYHNLAKLKAEDESIQIDSLLYCMGETAEDIFAQLAISDGDKKK